VRAYCCYQKIYLNVANLNGDRPTTSADTYSTEYERDHPQGDEVYKTPNLIYTFDRIVNNEAFASFGTKIQIKD